MEGPENRRYFQADEIAFIPTALSDRKAVRKMFGENGTLSLSAQKMILTFLQSPDADKLQRSIRDSKADSNYLDLSHVLLGKIFEGLAYQFVQKKIADPQDIVLSPDEVFELYVNSVPNEISVKFGGLMKGIRGISFPDGFILKETPYSFMINTVCEYKVGISCNEEQWKYYSTNQIEYNLGLRDKYLSEILGHFLAVMKPGISPKPLTIIPNVEVLYLTTSESIREFYGKKLTLPISRAELSQMVGVMLKA